MNGAPPQTIESLEIRNGLVLMVYDLTQQFPPQEQYELHSQLRRAAASVPANIAEGAAEKHEKNSSNSFMISPGSLNELDTRWELANRLGCFPREQSKALEPEMV